MPIMTTRRRRARRRIHVPLRGLGAPLSVGVDPFEDVIDPETLQAVEEALARSGDPARDAVASDAAALLDAQDAAADTDAPIVGGVLPVSPECVCLVKQMVVATGAAQPAAVVMAAQQDCARDTDGFREFLATSAGVGWMAADACRPFHLQRRVWIGAGVVGAIGLAWWKLSKRKRRR